jgi:transcription termination factor NusB
MPAPRQPRAQATNIITLKGAIDYINTLKNAANSKNNWIDSLTTLVHYNEAGDQAFFATTTKKEQAEQYTDINIAPLIKDYDKVVDIVETKIMSARSSSNIALDTQKQYYLAVVRLTQKGSPLQIPKPVRSKYNDKLQDVEKLSNKMRNKNEPKRGNAEHPDLTWNVAQKEYDDFITTHSFTNTAKGRKDLRNAAVSGLYVLQRPRRVTDYALLQYYSKKPTDKEHEDTNVLYADGDKLSVSIDKFKTRWRVSGGSNERKELMPRYVKEVNSRLASILKDYIKKWQVKDMSKLTPAEKRAKANFYVFYKETGTPADVYDEGSFSKVISNCFKQVFNKRAGLSVNSFRHIFNT